MRFYASSFVSIIAWSLYPLAILLAEGVNVIAAAMIAHVLAHVAWVVAYVLLERRGPYRSIAQKGVLGPILLAAILNVVETASFFSAVMLFAPVAGTITLELWVVFLVILVAILNRERIHPLDALLIAACFAGAATASINGDVSGGVDRDTVIGGALGAVAGLALAAKSEVHRRVAERLDRPKTAMARAMGPHILSTGLSVPIYAGAIWASIEMELFPGALPIREAVPIAITMAIGAPSFIFALLHKPTDASLAIYYCTPVLAVFFLATFGVQEITYLLALGGLLVISSNIFLALRAGEFSAWAITALSAPIFTFLVLALPPGLIAPRAEGAGGIGFDAFIFFYGALFVVFVGRYFERQSSVANFLRGLALRSDMDRETPEEIKTEINRAILSLVRETLGADIPADHPARDRLATLVGDDPKRRKTYLDPVFEHVATRRARNEPVAFFIFQIANIGFLLALAISLAAGRDLLAFSLGLAICCVISFFSLYCSDYHLREDFFPKTVARLLGGQVADDRMEGRIAKFGFVLALGLSFGTFVWFTAV